MTAGSREIFMFTFRKFPGGAPPRTAAAVAAVAVTVLLHGTTLGLFHRLSAGQWLLASPALERQLAGCGAAADAVAARQCRLAVVARAREDRTVTRVAAR